MSETLRCCVVPCAAFCESPLLSSPRRRPHKSLAHPLYSLLHPAAPPCPPPAAPPPRAACPPKGYTAHVLGYTVHAVVAAACSVAAPGDIDDSLLQLLALMEADLFGDVADAKEASEFASAYKEARKCRGYETYQLLAGVVAFGARIPQLLTTVQVGAGAGGVGVGFGGREWEGEENSVPACCGGLSAVPSPRHPLPCPALPCRRAAWASAATPRPATSWHCCCSTPRAAFCPTPQVRACVAPCRWLPPALA